MNTLTRQRGLSLIETLISLTIGLMLIGGLITVFVHGNQSFRQDLQLSRMQESARFALRTLSDEITLIGFFGDNLTPTVGTYSNFTTDCGPGGSDWAFDLTSTIQLHIQKSAADAESAFGCIDDATFVDGTDIFSIKRAEARGIATADLDPDPNGNDLNNVYISSSVSSSQITQYTGSNLDASKRNWRYLAHIYYIRNESLIGSDDGIPTLHRKSLQYNKDDGELVVDDIDGGIARGIEYFHIEFGVDAEAIDGNPDTRPDGIANYYTSNPSPGEFAAAVTAKIYVLSRSREPITGYANDKTYNLGTITVNPASPADHYYRRVFSTTVHLRNQASKAFVQHIVANSVTGN